VSAERRGREGGGVGGPFGLVEELEDVEDHLEHVEGSLQHLSHKESELRHLPRRGEERRGEERRGVQRRKEVSYSHFSCRSLGGRRHILQWQSERHLDCQFLDLFGGVSSDRSIF
jgi:hypothetical protein